VNHRFLQKEEEFEWTPLFVAAASDNAEATLFLLRQGADPNPVVQNETPLIAALAYGNGRIARILVERGANLLSCTNCLEANYLNLFNTPKFVQAHQHRTLHLDLNRYTSAGEPWLFEAVRDANLEAVKFMLQNGVSAKVTDRGQNTALHVLAQAWTGNKHCVFAHDAALQRRLRVAELLIENGSDIHAPNGEGGTPLRSVISNPDRQWRQMLATKLMAVGADARQPAPLYETIICGDVDLLKMLLAHGADPNQLVCRGGPRNEWQFTAMRVIIGLMLADPEERRTWIQMAELAVRHGGDLHRVDASGSSPIEDMRKSGHKDLIRRFKADQPRKR